MSEIKSIAFFDVDKTLCACYSGYHVVRELIRLRMLKRRHLIKAMLYKSVGTLFRQFNVRRMYEMSFADLAGFRLEDVMDIGKQVFDREVKPQIYVEAVQEVNRLRKAGYQIVLISSGPGMVIKHFEAFFKAHASFSIGPRVEEGILQREIDEPLCYEEGKVAYAKRYADSQGIALRDCTFYTDSISDRSLLLEVAHPRVVNPDKFLLAEANQRAWPVLNFKETLRERRRDS